MPEAPPQAEAPVLPPPTEVACASVEAEIVEGRPVEAVEAAAVEAAAVEAEASPPAAVEAAPERRTPTPTGEAQPSSPAEGVPPQDAEQMKAWALARIGYFSPAGYTPYQSRPPRLLAPDRSSAIAASSAAAARPGGEGVRDYFARPGAAPAAGPVPATPGVIAAVNPARLTAFFLCRENDPRSGNEQPFAVFLSEPELLARAIRLRDQALDNWLEGNAPWNLADFFARSQALAGDKGTALLLCHNAAKAFARGGAAIRWIKTGRARGEYFDGARSFTARVLHPRGVLTAGPFAPPSIFYLLFSASVFGTTDPGDWVRYFGSAALAWYVASGRTTVEPPPAAPFLQQWAAGFDAAARQLLPEGSAPPASRALALANAAAFVELTAFGRSPDSNTAAARVQLSGARFGLAESGQPEPAGVAWRVPAVSSTLDCDVPALTAAILDSSGQPVPFGAGPSPPRAQRAFSPALVEAVRAAAHPLPLQGGPVQLLATIEEGTACRFATASWDETLPPSLAALVADEIGWNVLEHASRRQVSLRCGGQTCEMDRGGGYEKIVVRVA